MKILVDKDNKFINFDNGFVNVYNINNSRPKATHLHYTDTDQFKFGTDPTDFTIGNICEACGGYIPNWRQPHDTCCHRCKKSLMFRNYNLDPNCEFNKNQKEANRRNWNNPEYKFVHRVDLDYHGFITKSTKESVLYIATLPNIPTHYKIGASNDIKQRNTWNLRMNNVFAYSNIEILYQGSVKRIAELEREIKLKFCDRTMPYSSTELFKVELYNEVKNFIKGSTTIENSDELVE